MVKYENQCVDCGLPCRFDGCPYYSVPVRYCDHCEQMNAEYIIDGYDYCEKCAKELENEKKLNNNECNLTIIR